MIKPIKDLGQNFLRNEKTISKFVEEIDTQKGDLVYEIGPGEGVLTKKILNNKNEFNLISIDIDERSILELSKIQDERFKLVHKDILKFIPEINEINYKIVGAIPYNITSPIIHKIIEKSNLPKMIVLIVQDEVAKKIIRENKNSYFSFLIGYFYEMEYVQKISRDDFFPVPRVDSGLIKFKIKNEFDEINRIKYSNFLHKVFRSPRKKINKVFDKNILDNAGISSDLRPEDLNLEQIIKLYKLENKI